MNLQQKRTTEVVLSVFLPIKIAAKEKWAMRDSNSRRPACKAGALTS